MPELGGAGKTTTDEILKVLGGLICTAWLGLFALIVIVFGGGGWESWSH